MIQQEISFVSYKIIFFFCNWYRLASKTTANILPPSTHARSPLTHWGHVTHICISKQTIIGSDNGLLPGRHQTIIWTSAGILLIGTLGTDFEILIEILISSFKKMDLKVSSAKWRPFLFRPQGVNSLVSGRWVVILNGLLPAQHQAIM